jgi:hypothetical protein
MKKYILTITMIMLLVLATGCKKENQVTDDNKDNTSPSPQPTISLPQEDEDSNKEDEDTDSNNVGDELTIEDYYTYEADTEYVYEGEGNEYAGYRRYIDFIDPKNKRIQTRTNNGGTETVRVLEFKDGKLAVVAMVNESYHRDNIMDHVTSEKESEVLLMEPLEEGNSWMLPDGRKRSITGTKVKVETPSGTYEALEVTTEGNKDTSLDYYAPQVGLVKSIFKSGDMTVTSSLSEANKDTPLKQIFSIYYPDVDEKIYTEQLELTFHTDDITRNVMEKEIKRKVVKESYLPLISTNTKINSLYLGDDNIVYVDFSAEMVNEMNAGSGYEQLILQSITNTLGTYYGVEKVYISLEGKPYESGHILMKKGETFKVKMDAVVE